MWTLKSNDLTLSGVSVLRCESMRTTLTSCGDPFTSPGISRDAILLACRLFGESDSRVLRPERVLWWRGETWPSMLSQEGESDVCDNNRSGPEDIKSTILKFKKKRKMILNPTNKTKPTSVEGWINIRPIYVWKEGSWIYPSLPTPEPAFLFPFNLEQNENSQLYNITKWLIFEEVSCTDFGQ